MGRRELAAVGPEVITNEGNVATLFRRRYPAMVRLAAWLMADSAAAEDVVQDAFVRLARTDLTKVDSPDAYLRTTVVNLTRTRQRRNSLARRHRIVSLNPVPGPESLLSDEELVAAVTALPRRQRECVVLRYTEDLPVADIAAALSISAGSVKTHLHRGLTALEHALGPQSEEGRAS